MLVLVSETLDDPGIESRCWLGSMDLIIASIPNLVVEQHQRLHLLNFLERPPTGAERPRRSHHLMRSLDTKDP